MVVAGPGSTSAALAVGLALCLAGQRTPTLSAPDPTTGNTYAALSGLTWAGTLLFLRRLGRDSRDEHDGLAAVVVGNVLAFLVALPAAWPLPAAPAGRVGQRPLSGRLPDRSRLCVPDAGHPPRPGPRGVAAAPHRASAQPDLDVAGARRDAGTCDVRGRHGESWRPRRFGPCATRAHRPGVGPDPVHIPQVDGDTPRTDHRSRALHPHP